MAERRAVSFSQDSEQHWVANLECGHTLHVRHRPPFETRSWVLSEDGRTAKIGAPFECLFCNMPALPPDVEIYQQTRNFDANSVPAALLAEHRLRPGTWGRLVVLDGRLKYQILGAETRTWVLRPGVDGWIAPEQPHRVALCGPVRFRVEFLKRPSTD